MKNFSRDIVEFENGQIHEILNEAVALLYHKPTDQESQGMITAYSWFWRLESMAKVLV